MAVLRYDLPDMCDCGRCGVKDKVEKFVTGPIIEKRTQCGTIKKIANYNVGHVVVPQNLPQVYVDYDGMCEVFYPQKTVAITKDHPMVYQIGIPKSLRGKLRIKVDMIQDCPSRRRKEESYTINLRVDDE